jgi:prepilin-type N-terminal cleavage/methylation domain-containing protein
MSEYTLGRRPARRDAFTLIEILVVLSIIIFLASMLYAALHRAKGVSLTTGCANKLMQLGHVMTHYRTDHSRYFGLISATGQGTNSLSSLYDYIDNFDMLICPATGNKLEIDRKDPDGAKVKLDQDPPDSTEKEGKSYETCGVYSNGTAMTTHTIRGFESDTWFAWDNDKPDEDMKLSRADNHADTGGNALDGNLSVHWIRGEDWEATVMAVNDQSIP